MKKQTLFFTAILMCFSVSTMAQNGTERLGITIHKYSRLKTQSNSPVAQYYGNSKSLGVYTSDIYPKSMLEVNTSSDYTQFFHPDIEDRGEVFRTVGPDNVDNNWRLFTGNTEKARFYVPANSDNLVIQASQLGSNIRFNIYPGLQRAILTDGKGQGHLGVGNNFSSPQYMIHIHTTPILVGQDPFPAYTGYSNSNTGATETDGFITGIEPDGTAELNQQENQNMLFSTGDGNNAQRMLIRGEAGPNQGFVGIGQDFNNPQSLLSIDGTDDNTGEVFRTNGSNADTTIWRFCQGNNEIAQFFSLPDSKDFIIGVDDVSSSIKINTGLLQKIIIKDSYGNTRVGIGNNFSHPQYTLHLHSSSFFPGAPIPSTQIAFTNDHTKSAKTDGFIVGISSTGEAQLKQQENQSMEFYTSNQEQLSITEKGKVVIASLASDTTTYIMADKNGQLHIDEFNAKKKSKNLKNA